MKIAMVGQKGIPATFGGVETCVEQLASALVARGHKVIVYCRNNYTPANTGSCYKGVDLRRLPSIGSKHLDAISHTAFSLADAAFGDADLVHFHGVGPGALVPMARLAGMPAVVTIHAADWLREKWSGPARFCLRRGLDIAVRYAQVLTTVSLSMVDFLADTYGVRTVYIPNGVALRKAARLSLSDRFGIRTERFALFAGRLVPEKDVHVLIEAFNELVAGSDFEGMGLLLAGDSSFSDSYVSGLRDMAGKDVHFLGVVSPEELASLYAQAEVCVLPSHLEGMPLVLLEAASQGCPVIAADIAANRQVLGQFAHYFEVGSSELLRKSFVEVLGNSGDAKRLAEESRSYVSSRFTWEGIAQQMEDAYECALDRA